MSAPDPIVVCLRCGRTCECVTVSDGTTYRPLAWSFPDQAEPLRGVCGNCQAPPLSDIRDLVLCDLVAICGRHGIAFDARPGSEHWKAADRLAHRVADIFSQTADPQTPAPPSESG